MTDLKADSYKLTFEIINDKGLSFILTHTLKVYDTIKVSSLTYK